MNKKTMLAAVALVAVVAVMLGIWWIFRPTPTSKNSGIKENEGVMGRKTITVQVIHSDGSKKNITYLTNADCLGEVLYSEGLIQNDGIDEGMFNVVDGEKAELPDYWWIYVGENDAMVGVDEIPVNDGDSFRLVYKLG